LNLDEIKDHESFLKETKNKEIVLRRMGWFSMKNLRVKYDPKLEDIEQRLKESFYQPIQSLKRIEQVSSFTQKKSETATIDLENIEQ
jgi:hypothetical protein